jgi:hypothetical protein
MHKGLTAFFIIGAASFASSFPLRAQMPSPQTPSTSTAPVNTVPNSAAPASDVYFINRAKNLARQAAIQANGGLSQYRPDPIMYGPAVQTAYVRNNNGSITFRFTGSAPGVPTPKFETVATVAATGVVNLDYNGALRTAIGAAALPGSSSGSANVNGPVSITVPEPTTSPASNTSPPNSSPVPLSPSDGPLPGTITPTSTPTQGASSSKPSTIAWVDQDAFVARAQNLARQAAIKANGGLASYRPEPSMFGPSAKSPFVKNADGSLTFSFQGGTPGAALTLISVVIVNPDGTVKIQYNGPPVR